MKILVADDSAFMRTILKASLKDEPGVEFMEAENGDVAVELYRQYMFDLVFLDIVMPVKNGIVAMEEIRQINPDAKIVIVTSLSQDEVAQKANADGATSFLAKPFQPQQIKDVYAAVLASAPAAAPAPVPAASAIVSPDVVAAVEVPPVAPVAPAAPVVQAPVIPLTEVPPIQTPPVSQ
jgi:two-component system, chemotaxis family, chemotaxis protein CheY